MKKILGIVAILGIAVMTAINVNLSSNTNFSNLMLRNIEGVEINKLNIEALAEGEGTSTSGSMTEAEYARLGCKPTIRTTDRCKANNGLFYRFAIRI